MKIYHAQVNHLEKSGGFRMERTVFSWKNKRSERKAAELCKIRVSSDEAMEHLLFDSGEDTKASSLCYPVKLSWSENTVLLDGGSRQRCRRKSSKRSAVF